MAVVMVLQRQVTAVILAQMSCTVTGFIDGRTRGLRKLNSANMTRKILLNHTVRSTPVKPYIGMWLTERMVVDGAG